jgi:O-antigen/teichoic acid export membrane protein
MIRSLILRTLVTNSGIMALGLVNAVLLSRWLGPTGRGELAAAMLWPTILVYLGSMGLISAVVYFSALPESKPESVLAVSLVLAFLQTLFLLPISFAVLPWLLSRQSPSVIKDGRLFLLIVPIGLVAQYGISILQGRLHFLSFNLIRTIIPIGYLAGVLAFRAAGNLTLHNIIVLHIVLQFIGLIAIVFALRAAGIRLTLRINNALAKQMLKFGAKVQIGDASQLANARLDQALMAGLLQPSQLGLYVVAVSSSSLMQVLSAAVRPVLTANLAQKKGSLDQPKMLQEVFRKYFVLSLVATLAIGVSLPFLIPLVFGSSFAGAVWPAEILLVGFVFTSAKDVLAGGAQALGSPWLASRAELVALGFTAVLLFLLLPTMGILGAAIATTVAYTIQLAVMVRGLNQTHAVSPKLLFRIKLDDFAKPLAQYLKLQGSTRIS